MKSVVMKNVPNIIVFLLNSVITYFALLFILFGLSQRIGYILFLIAVFTSHICFTVFPKQKRSVLLMIFLKILLHAVVSYLLMVVIAYIF